jgi:hypothetical protein
MALSRALPVLPIDGVMPTPLRLSEKESAVYCTPGRNDAPDHQPASYLICAYTYAFMVNMMLARHQVHMKEVWA